MANYYTICTAERCVPCTKEQYEELKVLLDAHEEKDLYPGFELEWDTPEEGVYIVTDDNSTPDEFSDEFLEALGKIIGAAGLPYLEFGCAFTCNKYRPGSHGGSYFRVYPDGDMVWVEKFWPSKESK